MDTINTIKEKYKIGDMVIASPETGRDWIYYSDSYNGEENYYRDYYDKETGIICYCFGETCKIEGFNQEKQTVLLSNEGAGIILEVFEIPYQQFIEDFGTALVCE